MMYQYFENVAGFLRKFKKICTTFNLFQKL